MCFFEMLVLKVNIFLTKKIQDVLGFSTHQCFEPKVMAWDKHTQNLSKSLETETTTTTMNQGEKVWNDLSALEWNQPGRGEKSDNSNNNNSNNNSNNNNNSSYNHSSKQVVSCWKITEGTFISVYDINFIESVNMFGPFNLVGGWTNPFEKICESQNGSSSPGFGVKIKNLWVATTQTTIIQNIHQQLQQGFKTPKQKNTSINNRTVPKM